MINKTMKTQFHNAQKILADAETALQSLYDMQQDLQSEFDDKSEKVQENLMEKEPWLQDFFDLDIDDCKSTVEMLAGLEIE